MVSAARTTEEAMSQVTFDTALGRQTAIKSELGAAVRRQMLVVRDRLKCLVSTPVGAAGGPGSGPLSTYYADAYGRTKVATPVTSLRDITGN
jgi:hypothetical protein